MLGQIEIFIRRLRRHFSRSHLIIKLLGLSRCGQYQKEKGLVLIQIDALSRKQLETAFTEGKVPFLKNLLDEQGYEIHSLYTGMPCSTAAVQAELFYGVKTAVPAFSFFCHRSNRLFTMFTPQDAIEIEQYLEKQSKPLLTGGSVYSDIYTGGAAESHFCISNLGTTGIFKNRYPLGFVIIAILHIYSLIRTAVLMIVEMGLAIIDCINGMITGKNLWKELKFVPSRVAICVLLRELITIGARIDVARGQPIIHLNLVGYHEQSHRRGPNSRFAKWTLRGIDDSIKRIWKAAHTSTVRNYDVWIYSDHGQMDTVPYEKRFGKPIEHAVGEVLDTPLVFKIPERPQKTGFLARAGLRGTKFFSKIISNQTGKPLVAALGPMGHIYLNHKVEPKEKEILAVKLIYNAHIPMVIIPILDKGVEIWTENGHFSIPEEANKLFNSAAPYYDEIVKDFIAVCHHPDSGDILICGWQGEGKDYYSFVSENGSHGGIGLEETEGFVFLPVGTSLGRLKKSYVRPLDLRNSAFEFLMKKAFVRPLIQKDTLRIMTYNVHSCVGMDGELSPGRIARVIEQYQPDVVALQELDLGRARSGKEDQAKIIAENLNMAHHFHAAMQIAEESFGDAILSSYPMCFIKGNSLSTKPRFSFLEPRGALWVQIHFNGEVIQIINTHLGLNGSERLIHTKELLGVNWLKNAKCKNPVVLCGDFNSLPGSKVSALFQSVLSNAQTAGGQIKHGGTWFGRWPILCLDHIFVSSDFEVIKIEVADSYLARLASDHRPLIAEIKLRKNTLSKNY